VTAIEVSDLHVVRGGARAVDGVSFAVPGGQVTGLLGPSGCGKTRLLRSVVGVQVVASGTVTLAVAGRVLTRTEFQAVQFMPAIVIPQVLLCGLFIERDRLPTVLGAVSDALPLSCAVDAMSAVSASATDAVGGVDPGTWADLGVVAGFAAAALGLGAATLRRRTP
jgi:ABC-2 type transport system permease protein